MRYVCGDAKCLLGPVVFAMPKGLLKKDELPICGICNQPLTKTDEPAWSEEQLKERINAYSAK